MKYINYKNLNLIFTIFILIKINIISTKNTTKANTKTQKSDRCTLTKKGSQDPFPSLSKCYKYNNEACCMSVHDDYINDYVESILSSSCIRKYPEFENLMCFGCHPLESNYIDTDKKIIRVCKSFAESLWNNSESENINTLDYPTTIFDNCGFKVELDSLIEKTNGSLYIIPSEEFLNFSDFFEYIKIPFYEDFKIVIQEETNDTCYNNSFNIKSSLLSYIFILIFSFLIIFKR